MNRLCMAKDFGGGVKLDVGFQADNGFVICHSRSYPLAKNNIYTIIPMVLTIRRGSLYKSRDIRLKVELLLERSQQYPTKNYSMSGWRNTRGLILRQASLALAIS